MVRSRPAILLSLAVVALAATALAPAPAAATKYNITKLLAPYKQYSRFNEMLSRTRLAYDINRRQTITVLAVDNAAMSALDHYSLQTIRHILSLHVLVDYYDDAKLHGLPGGSADVSTLFQASGDAPGSAGMVEIADRRGGRVAFAPQDAGDARGTAVFYVKSVHQAPYSIAVLQVSGVMSSPAAEAPSSSPESTSRLDVSDVMSKNGCGRFAGLIAATAGASAAFDKHTRDGLTFFCPADKAVEAFEPAFKELRADARLAVVLYHGALGHYSPQALRAGHDDLATLASDDAGATVGFAVHSVGGKATLVSATHKAARVTRTLADADPVAVYMIDAVLVPFSFTANASSPPDLGPSESDGRSGRKDGGDGRQTSGSAPGWPRRGWVASALVFTTLLAAFASG